MQESRLLMGMPITVAIADPHATPDEINKIFSYFEYIDETFSTYKLNSEISRINAKKIIEAEYSDDMLEILALAEETKHETDGYFDIQKADGTLDPSGIVKGWAVLKAAELLRRDGFTNFYIDAGGDIQADGLSSRGLPWHVGIRNPFSNNPASAIIKVLTISNAGVATSGSYLRGNHIYNPKNRADNLTDVVSLTVIGPNVYEADRFATAAFAMGKKGIDFIERLPGFEGYMIDANGVATLTSGFNQFVVAKDAMAAEGQRV